MCDMNDLMEIIKGRKSIRTFDGSTLSDMHRQILEDNIKDIPNPFGIPVEFVLLDAKEHGPEYKRGYRTSLVRQPLLC